jgi:hypothetical protein
LESTSVLVKHFDMDNEKQIETKIRSGYWKWILIPVLILLIFLGGLRWLVQSNMLLVYLKDIAEREISKQFHGDLVIGGLSGDLLNGIFLTDLMVTDEPGNLVMTTDSIRVNYAILDLIRKPHEVRSLTVDGLHVNIEQYDEGDWNLERLLPVTQDRVVDDEVPDMPHWNLGNLRIGNMSVSVRSPDLPDERISIRDLQLDGRVGYGSPGWMINVDDFRFLIGETRFIHPAEIEAAASMQGEQISVEKLMFNTGRSVLESHASIDGDKNVTGRLEFSPISWLDISNYADIPLQQDIRGSFGFEGSLSNLLIRLDIEAPGLESLFIESRVHIDNQLTISELSAELRNFDGPVMTGDSLAPVVDSIDLSGDGEIRIDRLYETRFSGAVSLNGIGVDTLFADQITLDYNWIEDHLSANLSVRNQGQFLDSNVEITGIYDELPAWEMVLHSEHLNLANLLDTPGLESSLNISGNAQGRGFVLSEEVFSIELNLTDGMWGDQAFSRILFSGNLSASKVEGLFITEIQESSFRTDFNIEEWQTEAVYTFQSNLRSFNLNEIDGVDHVPSSLNASIGGQGAGFDIDTLELTASVQFDSSFINYEPIENLYAMIEIRDQTVFVSEAEILSPIADVSFSLRQHLLDIRNPENRFDIEADIKDLQSLSPLAGVDSLNARGSISSQLYRADSGDLRAEMTMMLEEIVYDTLFSIASLDGYADILLVEEPEVHLDIDIQTPSVNGFGLQSVSVGLNAYLRENMTDGELVLDFVQDDENAVHHSGYFEYMAEDLLFLTRNLNVRSPERELSLQRPFETTWREGVVRMDTLHIQSPNGVAYLSLAIPHLDEHRQELALDARLLDLGTLQRSLLDEYHAEALLSGNLNFLRVGEEINTDAKLLFSEIRYNNGEIDSLSIDANIEEGRLVTSAGAWHGDTELLFIRGDIPI